MENASKALIMAAGVLIGVLLLSLMAYMFISFAVSSAEIHKENAESRLNQFNSQFTSYVGKEGITIYDVVTVANLATESNIYYEFPARGNVQPKGNDNYIAVRFLNSNITGYHANYIEKGFVDSRNSNYKQDITHYYNTLINHALNDMVSKSDEPSNANAPRYQALREYDCEVKISETTGRVYLVTFKAKNIY